MSTVPTASTASSPALGSGPTPTRVTVRFFAGARAAAGTSSRSVELPDGASLDVLLRALVAEHGDALARVLSASSFLVDEVAVHDRGVELGDGAVLDVLPPFAGG